MCVLLVMCLSPCCPAEFLEGFDTTFASEVERRQQLEGAIVQEMAAISQVGGMHAHIQPHLSAVHLSVHEGLT